MHWWIGEVYLQFLAVLLRGMPWGNGGHWRPGRGHPDAEDRSRKAFSNGHQHQHLKMTRNFLDSSAPPSTRINKDDNSHCHIPTTRRLIFRPLLFSTNSLPFENQPATTIFYFSFIWSVSPGTYLSVLHMVTYKFVTTVHMDYCSIFLI